MNKAFKLNINTIIYNNVTLNIGIEMRFLIL